MIVNVQFGIGNCWFLFTSRLYWSGKLYEFTWLAGLSVKVGKFGGPLSHGMRLDNIHV